MRSRSASARVLLGVAAGAFLVVAAGAVAGPAVALALMVAACVLGALWRSDPAITFSVAFCAYIFTGNSTLMGFPFDPARLIIALGFVQLLRDRAPEVRQVLIHDRESLWQKWWMLIAVCYLVASAFIAGTLFQRDSIFYLLDSYGLVPFFLFLVAPLIFDTDRRRKILLAALSIAAAYLAILAPLEVTGHLQYVFPRYIANPAYGIHFGRARGPFLASVPEGLALTLGLLLAMVWIHDSKDRRVQVAAAVLALGCGLGVLFTLTRGAWIAAAVAFLMMLVLVPRYRSLLPLIAIATTLGIGLFLAAVPSVSDKVTQRADDSSPVWERQNTIAASFRVIHDKPLFGLGFSRWVPDGNAYLKQPKSVPLYGTNVAVHNVPLLTASELGLAGAAAWFGAILICVLLPLFRRPPPELVAMRAMTVALLAAWFVAGQFAPQLGPFSAILLWTFAGIVNSGSKRALRQRRAGAAARDAEGETAATAGNARGAATTGNTGIAATA